MILIFGNWAVVTYEIPKVIVFQWTVRFLTLALAVSFFTKPKRWKVENHLTKLVIGFTAVAIIASIFGENPTKSFVGNFYRNDGLITFLSLVGFAFIVSYFWKEEFNLYLAEAVYWVSTFLSLFFLASPITPQFSGINAAGFGNSVFLAGYLLTSLPLSFYYVREKSNKYLRLGLLVQVISLFFMNATAAIVVLFVYVLMLVKRYVKIKAKNLLIVCLGLAVFLTGAAWLRNYYTQSTSSLIAEGRARIFINGWQGYTARPLLGYGWSNFDAAFQKGSWPIKLNNDVYVDRAHAEFLEVLVTTGIVGFGIYICFVFGIYKRLRNASKTDWGFTLFSIFIIYILHSQTNVISITEQILFWLVVGYSLKI